MTAVVLSSPFRHTTSTYSFSSMPSFSPIWIAFASTSLLPFSTASELESFRTSSPYSDLPMMAPRAMAIGRPIMSVPGMPTPMAFFRMLALKKACMSVGRLPSISVALAVQRATAIGSVQPIAGTTSLCISAIICSLSSLGIILSFTFYSSSVRSRETPHTCLRLHHMSRTC